MSDATILQGGPSEAAYAAVRIRATGLGFLVSLAGTFLPFPWVLFLALEVFGGWSILWLGPLALVVGWIFWSIVLAAYGIEYRRRFHYEVGTKRLEVHRGVVFRQQVQVPYARIQEVTLMEGPLQRRHGLATVKVQTAAAGAQSKAEVRIVDIAHEGARPLVDAIVERARAAGAPVAA